jgi:hypothetical protein
MQLASGARSVEPVEGVRGHRAVDRAVGQRDRLGAPREHAAGADLPPEDRPHGLERLERDDVEAGVEERPADDAGPGTELEDPRAAERVGDCGDRRGPEARAPARVGVGVREPPYEVVEHEGQATRDPLH